MRKLQNGYDCITTAQVYQWLHLFIKHQDAARPLLGDLQLAAKILYDVHLFDSLFGEKEAKVSLDVSLSGCNSSVASRSKKSSRMVYNNVTSKLDRVCTPS